MKIDLPNIAINLTTSIIQDHTEDLIIFYLLEYNVMIKPLLKNVHLGINNSFYELEFQVGNHIFTNLEDLDRALKNRAFL